MPNAVLAVIAVHILVSALLRWHCCAGRRLLPDPEEVPGFDLRGAAIGSEGMFGIVTRVLVRLMKTPQAFKTFLCIFESVDEASQAVSGIIAASHSAIGCFPDAISSIDVPKSSKVPSVNWQ